MMGWGFAAFDAGRFHRIGLAFGFCVPPFTFLNLTKNYPCVKDIFSIRLIVKEYRYGVAPFEVFCSGRRGAALWACIAQIAGGPACAFSPDSGFGGRSRLQTFRPPSARRKVECSRQAVSGRCEAHPSGNKRCG